LHPDTLRYLVASQAASRGFEVQYRQQVREADRLDRVVRPVGRRCGRGPARRFEQVDGGG